MGSQDGNQRSIRGAFRCKNVSKTALNGIALLSRFSGTIKIVSGRHSGYILASIGTKKYWFCKGGVWKITKITSSTLDAIWIRLFLQFGLLGGLAWGPKSINFCISMGRQRYERGIFRHSCKITTSEVDFWSIFWLLEVQMRAQADNFLYFRRRELSAREARARF